MNGSANWLYPNVSIIAVTAASVAASLFTASYYCNGLSQPPHRKPKWAHYPVSEPSPSDDLHQSSSRIGSTQPAAPLSSNAPVPSPRSQSHSSQHIATESLAQPLPSIASTGPTVSQLSHEKTTAQPDSNNRKHSLAPEASKASVDGDGESNDALSYQPLFSSDHVVPRDNKLKTSRNGSNRAILETKLHSIQLAQLLEEREHPSSIVVDPPASSKSEYHGNKLDQSCTISKPNAESSKALTLKNELEKPIPANSFVTSRFSWFVFWDVENVAIPHDISVSKFVHTLRNFLCTHRNNDAPDPVARIIAIGDRNKLSEQTQAQLFCSGVTVQHAAQLKKHKDFSDKAILTEMCLLTLEHPPPCGIALLSGDVDFSYCISRLTALSYYTLIIAHHRAYSSPFAAAPTVFLTLAEVLQSKSLPISPYGPSQSNGKTMCRRGRGHGGRRGRQSEKDQNLEHGRNAKNTKNTKQDVPPSHSNHAVVSTPTNVVGCDMPLCMTGDNHETSCITLKTSIVQNESSQAEVQELHEPVNVSLESKNELCKNKVPEQLEATSRLSLPGSMHQVAACLSDRTKAGPGSHFEKEKGRSRPSTMVPLMHSTRCEPPRTNAQGKTALVPQKVPRSSNSPIALSGTTNLKLHTVLPDDGLQMDKSKMPEKTVLVDTTTHPGMHPQRTVASNARKKSNSSYLPPVTHDVNNAVNGTTIHEFGSDNMEPQTFKRPFACVIEWGLRSEYFVLALKFCMVIFLILYCSPVGLVYKAVSHCLQKCINWGLG